MVQSHPLLFARSRCWFDGPALQAAANGRAQQLCRQSLAACVPVSDSGGGIGETVQDSISRFGDLYHLECQWKQGDPLLCRVFEKSSFRVKKIVRAELIFIPIWPNSAW